MGANKNSDLQKCGELLIDITKIKHKTKSYTYRCAFCGVDCEQLKKFTKHLEDKHFQNFDEEEFKCDPVKTESECSDLEDFKLEPHQQQVFIVKTNDDNITANSSSNTKVHCDPLNMLKIESNVDDLVENYDVLKIEKKEIEIPDLKVELKAACDDLQSDNENVMSFDDFNSEIEPNNSTNCSDESDVEVKRNKKNINGKHKKGYTSDVSIDDLDDSDFEIEKKLNSKKPPKKPKKESKKYANNRKEPKKELEEDSNKVLSERCILKPFLPLIIEQYKKHEQLWKVDDIAFGVKPVRWEILGKIADEIKPILKKNITTLGVHKKVMYLNRLYSKDKKQYLICRMENKEFIPESDYYNELSSFLSESQGPFICSICNKMILKYDPYCIHLAEHNGTQPFKCISCGMTFSKLHKYKIHKKRHLGVYNHHCKICGKGYLFQAELDYHVTSHTGVKPILCSICGARFRKSGDYKTHMLRHENRFRHECHICKKGFMYKQALNIHVKGHLEF